MRGKYIAICEGDDFWTDAGKLEKQVHFMEKNPGYVICSHNCLQLIEADQSIKNNSTHHHSFSYDRKMFLTEWVTLPLTCVVRNIFDDYTRFNKEGIFCDVIFFYELLTKGSGYFMPDNMATFRVHKTALSSGLSNWQWQINNIIMYDYLYKYHPEDKSLQKKSAHYCLVLYVESLRNGTRRTEQFEPLAEYYKRTPHVVEKIFTGLVKVPYYYLKFGLFGKKEMSPKVG